MRKDAVTPELRWAVIRRDGICFVYLLDRQHKCQDAYGNRHSPRDLHLLTVDHVHDEGGKMGKRAPSDEQHLVAMCARANVAGPSRLVRQAERLYLDRLYNRTAIHD